MEKLWKNYGKMKKYLKNKEKIIRENNEKMG